MDFEVLTGRPKPPSFLASLERLIGNRRSAWHRWEVRQPHALGWFIFLSVTLELVIGSRLLKSEGFDLSLGRQIAITGGGILILELLLAMVTTQAAEIFESEGHAPALITFFNLGLAPLLLILPASILVEIVGHANQVRLILLMLLLTKVLLNWREAIELTHKLTRMQSALVFYVTAAISFVALLISAYVMLFNRVASYFH